MNLPLSTKKIVYYIARRIGLDPLETLSPDQAYEILDAMNDRLREGWEMYDFLEIISTDERAFRNQYDPSLCYGQGQAVWDWASRQYYEAVNTGVGGPLSNPAVWLSTPTVTPAYVEWFQPAQKPIGACFKAYTLNPFEDIKAVEVPFVISPRGLEFVVQQTPPTVWINYRTPYPGLGMFDWVSTQVYSAGESVIFGDDTYHSLLENNVGNSPDLKPDAWLIFKIPYVLARFVQQAAFSDTLIVNGQNEKAQLEEGKAYAYLSGEFDKQTLQQQQQQRFSVYTGP
jgi:hypothetical protein